MRSHIFRQAIFEDLPAIIALLADDELGSARENVTMPPDEVYQQAFKAIMSDSNQLLAVADLEGVVEGCLQLSFIPGLSRMGMWRGQIESVRIASASRGSQLGTKFLQWAITQCKDRKCGLVQLTSDNTRPDAIRFYESLGFENSHSGMKKILSYEGYAS
ncbi:MAG: GNAT family N-acetyltransferase [Aquisalinus sp.]|nr:GNAT family N-acetyltransferase [Aquisalinus sp.]